MLNSLIGIIASSGAGGVANSYESISTVTVGASSVGSITFSSIPSTYQHLQIRGISRNTNAGTFQQLQGRLNSDTGSNYASHVIQGDGSSAGTLAYSGITVFVAGQSVGSTGTANAFGVSVTDLLDYKDTNKYKTIRSLSGQDRNGGGTVLLTSGLWMNTAAVTSITLFPSTSDSFTQYSSFALYGIKG
jgi:hypothetical protein